MRKLYVLSLLIILPTLLWSQVGINTTHFEEGVIFQVEGDGTQGVILTRSNIVDLNTEAPLPAGIEDGTLTFNTNTTTGIGYVWWDNAAHTWRFVDPFLGKKAQFKNAVQDGAAGNLNQIESIGFQVPLLGSQVFNESPALYTVINNGKELRVAAKGRYRIVVTLGIEAQEDGAVNAFDDDNNIIEARLKIENSSNIRYSGSFYHSTEMDDNRNSRDDDGSISFVEILELQKDDIISLEAYRSSAAGNNPVFMNRPSNFFIVKIN